MWGPDSSFTPSAPASLTIRPQFRRLSASSTPMERNGMSATTNARSTARATAAVWLAISSTVTGRVES